MTPNTLFRLGAIIAILGGGLRIASAFIPYRQNSAFLEALYGVVDLMLIVGLTATYLHEASRIGWPGLTSAGIAYAGLASIVGPDGFVFGIDWYQVGAGASALGMAGLGVSLLVAWRKILPALLWLAVPFTAISLPQDWAFQAAGILFGLGFVAAGVGIWVQTPRSTG